MLECLKTTPYRIKSPIQLVTTVHEQENLLKKNLSLKVYFFKFTSLGLTISLEDLSNATKRVDQISQGKMQVIGSLI